MMKAKYEYTIYKVASEEYFKKQCEALEKQISNIKKAKLLEDVDGSKIQVYKHDRGEVRVCNDYFTNCLYVESEFDLTGYFG